MRLFEGTPFDRPPRCDRCNALESECKCPPPPPERIPPQKQTARIQVEKRKHGRLMTVIRGLPAVGNDLPGLLKQLKSECGAGGAVEGDLIEIQGDHVDRARGILSGLGFRVQGK